MKAAVIFIVAIFILVAVACFLVALISHIVGFCGGVVVVVVDEGQMSLL